VRQKKRYFCGLTITENDSEIAKIEIKYLIRMFNLFQNMEKKKRRLEKTTRLTKAKKRFIKRTQNFMASYQKLV
jgi:hypothetical protein